MQHIFTWLIVQPMGYIIETIYRLIPNYGVTLIVFTLVIKLILLPLSLKSQRSMTKQQKLAPQMAELQKKYANDKDKLNKEMMELYKANGVSPASGCLPMLLQLPIIFGLFQVIQKPISYMLHINFNLADNINKTLQLQEIVKNTPSLLGMVPTGFGSASMKTLADQYQIAMSNVSGYIDGFMDWKIDFNFLGLDLSKYPNETWGPISQLLSGQITHNLWVTLPLLLIPIMAGASSWLLTKMTPQPAASQAAQANANGQGQANAAANMNKSMLMLMPVMSAVFTFTLPAGVGLYWTISNVVQMIQQYFTQKHFQKEEGNSIVIDTVKKNSKSRKKHR